MDDPMMHEAEARIAAAADAIDHLPLAVVAELHLSDVEVAAVGASFRFGPDVLLTPTDEGAVLAVRVGDRLSAVLYREREVVARTFLPLSALQRGQG
jgi:hypothetical protein